MSTDDGLHFHRIGPPDASDGGLLHLAFNHVGKKLYAALESSSKPTGVYVLDIGDVS